jgi:hypothetical protein
MIQDESSPEVTEDGVALFVDCKEELIVRMEGEAGDVGAVGEWQGVGFVVDQVEDCHSVPNRREKRCSIGCVHQVPFAIYAPQ